MTGLQLIQRKPMGDERGYLERLFCTSDLEPLIGDRGIVQINHTLSRLQWQPRWSIETALDMTIAWHQAQWELERMDEFSLDQISVFESA